MAKRPTHTLVFVGTDRTDRVDLGPGPDFEVLAQNHLVPHDTDDLVIRVESALAATRLVGKLVWVLWEGAVAQMLDMPTGAVDGLEPQQLADSLSFEAEPLTGVPAGDSAIDGIPQRIATGLLPDSRRYWVTQLSAAVRNRLEEAVNHTDAKLAGITHPGGLPRAQWSTESEADNAAEWRRIEVWDQLIFSLHGRPDGTVETRLIRATPGAEWWAAELPTHGAISWLGPAPATRVGPGGQRVADTFTLFTTNGDPIQPVKIDLPANEVPVEWLQAWAAELTAKVRRVPVVATQSRVSPYRKFYLTGGLAAAITLALCLGHSSVLGVQTLAARAQADKREALRSALAPKDNSSAEEAKVTAQTNQLRPDAQAVGQRDAELTARHASLQKAAAQARAEQDHLGALQALHRPALAELLGTLADAERQEDPASVVIKEVRQQDNGALKLAGLCKHSGAADEFATRLESRLTKAGWKVGAAQKHLRADQLAFDFSVELTPQVLTEPAPPGGASPNLAPASGHRAAQSLPPATGGIHS